MVGDSVNPYFPQVQSKKGLLQYRTYDIAAQWYPENFHLPILSQTRRINTNFVITPQDYYSPAFQGTKMQWENPIGVPFASLKNGSFVSTNGLYYIGEGVNENDLLVHPPECLITQNPTAGEVISEHSRVFASPSNNTLIIPDFHWTYHTIQHYDTWGHYTDCWRTGLWEHVNNHVYNYIFAKEVGMVDFWHGIADSSNNVSGMRFYAFPTV